jgi:Ca2+-binding EF-hand superfamily protein
MDVSGIGLNALLGQYGVNASQSAGDLDAATSRLVQKKDKDGSGTLSAVEISISEEGFKQADANKDGQLDADELEDSFDTIAAELMTARLIQDRDRDGDGALGAEELPVSSKVFDAADTNQDGVLSFDELAAAGEAIDEGLRADQAPGRPNLIEQLFSSKSDDEDTQTTLDQIL